MVQRNLFAMQISLLLAFILFYSSTASTVGKPQGFFGFGWAPVTNTNDPKVVGIGRFAVAEHNKIAHTALQFVAVVKCQTRFAGPGNGIDYKLTITVRDYTVNYRFGVKTYEVVVSDKGWPGFGSLFLVSFTEIVGPPTSTWVPITNLYDPSVVEIAKFAVDEHNKVTFPVVLNFINVVNGKTLSVNPATLQYKLTIRAGGPRFVGRPGFVGNYEALVISHNPNSPWKKFELISFTVAPFRRP